MAECRLLPEPKSGFNILQSFVSFNLGFFCYLTSFVYDNQTKTTKHSRRYPMRHCTIRTTPNSGSSTSRSASPCYVSLLKILIVIVLLQLTKVEVFWSCVFAIIFDDNCCFGIPKQTAWQTCVREAGAEIPSKIDQQNGEKATNMMWRIL